MIDEPQAEGLLSQRSVPLSASQCLSEKGSDPLRQGPITHEIDLPPKGQTPFRRGSQ